jgi:hypothetical protein
MILSNSLTKEKKLYTPKKLFHFASKMENQNFCE